MNRPAITQRPVPGTAKAGAITTRGEAEALIARLEQSAIELERLLKAETQAARLGDIKVIAEREGEKTAATRLYASDMALLRANAVAVGHFAPVATAELRRRHQSLSAVIESNLVMLATVQGVAEGIMRAAVSEVAQRDRPTTYGVGGRAGIAAAASRPVALNRSA